ADAHRAHDVFEVHEHALRGLRPQVDLRRGVLDGADVRLEHRVEAARFAERAATDRAPVGPLQLVSSEALLALATAFDEWVGEVLHVAGGHPDQRMHDDRGLEADDVVPEVHDVTPPEATDVAPERHAVRSVVVQSADSAIDLAGRVYEPTALGKRRDLLHQVLTFTDHASDLVWRGKRGDMSLVRDLRPAHQRQRFRRRRFASSGTKGTECDGSEAEQGVEKGIDGSATTIHSTKQA